MIRTFIDLVTSKNNSIIYILQDKEILYKKDTVQANTELLSKITAGSFLHNEIEYHCEYLTVFDNDLTIISYKSKMDVDFEDLLTEFTNFLPVGIAVFRQKNLIYRNKRLVKLLDLPAHLIYAKPWMHLQEEYKNKVIEMISSPVEMTSDIYMDLSEGKEKWFMITNKRIKRANQNYTFLLFKDISHIKKREFQIENEKTHLNDVLDSLFEALIVIDSKNKVTRINLQAKKLLEITDDIKFDKIEDILHVFDNKNNPINYLIGESLKSSDYEIESLSGANYYVNLHIRTIYDHNKNNTGKVISFFDIGAQKKREKDILYLTYHDVLTGLHNRTFFEEQLKITDVSRKLPLSIIMGDVNGLKLTNDVFGHSEGDNLLKNMARILQRNCRKDDIIARWGGDEFIVILPNTSEHQATLIMNRVTANIEEKCYSDKLASILPSLSLGLGIKIYEDTDIYDVIKIAESNMYKSKMLTSSSSYSSIITSMTNSLYEKSSETEEHAQRLYANCFNVAQNLNFSDSQMKDLELLAKLHDIGKIGVPDNILNKPGKLTNEEWIKMKTHPEIGYRIAKSAPELKSIAECILSHHERWDGTGYPRGISGSDIPILSRILSVADAYDAMTNDRPYQKAMTKKKAIVELIDNSGTQFDPMIVKNFIDILK